MNLINSAVLGDIADQIEHNAVMLGYIDTEEELDEIEDYSSTFRDLADELREAAGLTRKPEPDISTASGRAESLKDIADDLQTIAAYAAEELIEPELSGELEERAEQLKRIAEKEGE